MRRYPHQLSGGMQQRVVIAMALAKDPTLLILDEPTTGLDATVEAEVLDLVAALRAEFGTTVLFISHNLDVITKMCDRVGVLYAGRLVEEGPVQQVFDDPRHPYAVGLLRCLPRGGVRKDRERLDTIPGFLPQLGADLPACVFVDRCAHGRRTSAAPRSRRSTRSATAGTAAATSGSRRTSCRARRPPRACSSTVDAESEPGHPHRGHAQDLPPGGSRGPAPSTTSRSCCGAGETLGLVGESGSGKTTLARALLGLTAADQGSVIELDGHPLAPGIGKRDADQVARGADRLPEPGLGAEPALLGAPDPRVAR